MPDPLRVLICGTGNSAHVLAGLAGAQPGVDVCILTRSAEKAARWRQSMADGHPLTVTVREGEDVREVVARRPFRVTTHPEEAVPERDLIILAVPAFCHRRYLQAIAPQVSPGATLVGLPGQNGFEFEVRDVLGARLQGCAVMNFESLPWICRMEAFGRRVRVRGTKERVAGGFLGDAARLRLADPLAALQRLVGTRPVLKASGHALGITLMSLNAYSHPPIMYGRWKDWDGRPLDAPALFYQGVDAPTAALMEAISAEVVATSRTIMRRYPSVDLSHVIPMHDWDRACYGHLIADPTTLQSALRTNAGYAGITHPMIETDDGRYVPDFGHRFLAEDIPYGLVTLRGIAEIAGVATPAMDTVLRWGQARLGKEYLVGGRLQGRDLAATRSPQRYGHTTLQDLLGLERPQSWPVTAISPMISKATAAPNSAVISA